MKLAIQERVGVSKQRGFWLRCFVSRSLFGCFAIWMMFVVAASAQIDVVTFHLPKVRGAVTDKSGVPVANAEVDLVSVSDSAAIWTVKTNPFGSFRIDCNGGSYWLQIKATGLSTASMHVIVASDLRSLFHQSQLHVALGPNACMDECSWVYTSKRKFDHAVRLNRGH
jgi:hypothetical protein